MSSRRFRRVRHRAEHLAVQGLAALLRPLRMEQVRACGEVLGRAIYRVAPSRRQVAIENLGHAFPSMPPAERERIVQGMFAHFTRMLLELMRFDSLSRDEMLSLIEMEGDEHVRRAYDRGKGLVLLGAHFGYWEMQGLTQSLFWKPIAVMARPGDNPELHATLEGIRTRTGNQVIYRQGSMRKVLRALGENRGVAILIDQHLHTPGAIHVNFFGRPAATTSVVGLLVRRTGATVVPAFALPLPRGRYRFVYEAPVEPPADDSPESIHDFTQRCTDVIEAYIRRHPDLWMWMHRRWRAAPDAAAAFPGAETSAVHALDPKPHG